MRQRTTLLGVLVLVVLTITAIALCYLKRCQYVETLLLWLLVLIPGLFLWAVHSQYRSVLQGRKDEIASILNRGKAFAAYLRAYEPLRLGQQGKSHKQTMDGLFYRKYGRSRYRFPLAVNAVLGGLFFLVVLVWARAPMRLPADLTERIRELPLTTIAGLAGAYIWGLYDVLRRFEAVDLSPAALHSIWLRMLVASILAPMLSAPFTDSLKPTIAFAVGLFPTKELFDFIKGQARKQLNLTMSAQPAEAPNLYKLQGLSEGLVDRLVSEGIESASQLATADPVKLLLNTNIEWKTILDVIDEAILFGYFSDKVVELRSFGIRGVGRLASIQDGLESKDAGVRKQAEELLSSIATVVERPEAAVRNAIYNADTDYQVAFLWHLRFDTDEGIIPTEPTSSTEPASTTGDATPRSATPAA